MPRIFVAVWVGETVRSALGALPERDNPELRWVPENQIHITLRFLGDIAERDVERVHAAVKTAARGNVRFRLHVGGLGAFPNERRSRVIWAGITAAEPLLRLQANIDAAMVQEGFPPDARPFKPHITLARTRREIPLPRGLSTYRTHPFGVLDVDAVDVVESRLGPSGPAYRTRHTVALGD